MKKTLSIILSLALLLGAVVVFPALSASATGVEFADYDSVETLFDNTTFTDHKNPDNDNKFWLDANAWKGSGNNSDGLFIGPKKVTSKLLEYNKVTKTDVTDFEWQFNLRSGHSTSANTAQMSFCFHVNDNSNITATGRYKTLAVTLFGADYDGALQQPLSLVAEYAKADNSWFPVLATKVGGVNKPAKEGYIDISGFANKSGEKYTTLKAITINIKLNYNVLIVTVWETNKPDTAKRMEVVIPEVQFKEYTPSGDFVITNNSGANNSNYNMLLAGMTIKSDTDVLYNKGKATVNTYRWWENNTIYEYNSGESKWEAKPRGAGYLLNADAVQLNTYGVADRLLENNGTLPTDGVENFVWGFDFTPGRTWKSKTSFAFHVNEDSVTTGVTTKDGDTVTNFEKPYDARKNMIAVTFCSKNSNSSTELADGIVIQQSDANGNMTALETESGYITKGALAYPEQAAADLTCVDLNSNTDAIFYSVRIVYNEGTVTVYMWKRGDTSTMFAVSAEIDESLVHAAGDFSIINANNYAYLDNMFISSLDGDTTEAEDAVKHYKDIYEEITKTELCAHDYDSANEVDPTCFVDGSKDLKCAKCNDALASGIKVPATGKALKDEPTATFADGKLSIYFEYSTDLLKDIANYNADISFNYSIGGGEPKKVEVSEDNATGFTINLTGFNAERLNSEITYYLSADIGSTTHKDTEYKVTANTLVTENSGAYGDLVSAINDANALDAVISGTFADADEFTNKSVDINLKEGSMLIKFQVNDETAQKLRDFKELDANRINKVIVKIGNLTVEREKEVFTRETKLQITGMSFEQLYSDITIQLVFDYTNDNLDFETKECTFKASDVISASDNTVAKALASYMNVQ